MDCEEEEIEVYIILEEMYTQMMLMFSMVMVMMYVTIHRHYQKLCLKEYTFVRHEGPVDVVENLEAEGNNEIRVNEMNTSTSVTQAANSQPPTRKGVRSTDLLATSLKDMRSMIELCVGSMDKRMGDIAEKLGQAKDLSKDRRRIIEELQKMTTLTPRGQIAVARKIGERADYVDLFFSANDEYKQEFVAMLLEEGC